MILTIVKTNILLEWATRTNSLLQCLDSSGFNWLLKVSKSFMWKLKIFFSTIFFNIIFVSEDNKRMKYRPLHYLKLLCKAKFTVWFKLFLAKHVVSVSRAKQHRNVILCWLVAGGATETTLVNLQILAQLYKVITNCLKLRIRIVTIFISIHLHVQCT